MSESFCLIKGPANEKTNTKPKKNENTIDKMFSKACIHAGIFILIFIYMYIFRLLY